MRTDHDDKRMELTEHLGELRTRIIRCVWYLLLGSIIAYQFFTPIYNLMYRPLRKEIDALNIHRTVQEAQRQVDKDHPPYDPRKLPKPHNPPTNEDLLIRDDVIAWMYTHPATPPMIGDAFNTFYEPFTVRLQLSVIIGFILTTPFIIREIALFILPALTPQERKPLRMLLPVSIFCLILGVCVAYATLFFAMHWFLSVSGRLSTGFHAAAKPRPVHSLLRQDDGGVRVRVPIARAADGRFVRGHDYLGWLDQALALGRGHCCIGRRVHPVQRPAFHGPDDHTAPAALLRQYLPCSHGRAHQSEGPSQA